MKNGIKPALVFSVLSFLPLVATGVGSYFINRDFYGRDYIWGLNKSFAYSYLSDGELPPIELMEYNILTNRERSSFWNVLPFRYFFRKVERPDLENFNLGEVHKRYDTEPRPRQFFRERDEPARISI